MNTEPRIAVADDGDATAGQSMLAVITLAAWLAVRHRTAIMGLLGLVSAPVAWAAAKGVQRGVQWMIGAPLETLGPLVYQVGAAKALEYALLGVLVGRLLRNPSSTLRAHALTGLAVGIVFGAVILWLSHVHAIAAGAPLPAVRIAAICTNEIIFPVGCSIVIYFVARLADRASALERLATDGG